MSLNVFSRIIKDRIKTTVIQLDLRVDDLAGFAGKSLSQHAVGGRRKMPPIYFKDTPWIHPGIQVIGIYPITILMGLTHLHLHTSYDVTIHSPFARQPTIVNPPNDKIDCPQIEILFELVKYSVKAFLIDASPAAACISFALHPYERNRSELLAADLLFHACKELIIKLAIGSLIYRLYRLGICRWRPQFIPLLNWLAGCGDHRDNNIILTEDLCH